MKNIHVGNIIAAKRKEKGITQEDLAAYLGVSKPAVSKWESDNSYPDITLLPVIAAYFNISIDELIGYEPQMNEEDIKKLYQKLTDSFATRPFEEVYKECKEYIKKYYSCWRFLYYMALLFVNHSNLAGPMEKVLDMIKEAAELFERVVSSSNEPSLAKQAEQLQAYCYLCMGQQAKSIDLLENTIEQCTPSDVILAKAYQMNGDNKKSLGLLQGYLYKGVTWMIGAIPDLMLLYTDDVDKMEQCMERAKKLWKLFEFDKINPISFFIVYLTAAYVYLNNNDKDKALEALEDCVTLVHTPGTFPLKLKGNEFFDTLDEFFEGLEFGTNPPRNEEIIKQSIRDSILKNPAFEGLIDQERFQQIKLKLDKF